MVTMKQMARLVGLVVLVLALCLTAEGGPAGATGAGRASFGTTSNIYKYDLETSTSSPHKLQVSTGKFASNEESFSLAFKHS